MSNTLENKIKEYQQSYNTQETLHLQFQKTPNIKSTIQKIHTHNNTLTVVFKSGHKLHYTQTPHPNQLNLSLETQQGKIIPITKPNPPNKTPNSPETYFHQLLINGVTLIAIGGIAVLALAAATVLL